MADSLNKDMDFCKCQHFISKQDNEDECECGHDLWDHMHQMISSCGSRVD